VIFCPIFAWIKLKYGFSFHVGAVDVNVDPYGCVENVNAFGIKEMTRTGRIAMTRGSGGPFEMKNNRPQKASRKETPSSE